MKHWLKLSALLLIVSAIVVFYVFHLQDAERRYAGIRGGMTPAEVEAVMGRPPDDDLLGDEEWDVKGKPEVGDRQDWNFSWFGKKRTVIVMFVRGRAREKILIDISGSREIVPFRGVRTPILAQEYFD